MNILLVKLLILSNLISYLYTIIHNTYKYILHVIDITGHVGGPHPKSVPVRPDPIRLTSEPDGLAVGSGGSE
jgi:hypothetical protein